MMKAKLTMAGTQTHAVKVRNTLGHLNKAAKTRTITHHQLFHSLLPGLEKKKERPRLHVAEASTEEGKAQSLHIDRSDRRIAESDILRAGVVMS